MTLRNLAREYGYDSEMAMFNRAISDAVAPATCTNDGCDYTTELEPDGRDGMCELCGTRTVASCLIIARLI